MEFDLTVVDSARAAAEFDRWLDGRRWVAVDTETTGIHIWSLGWRLRLVQIADEAEAWVFNAEAGRFADRVARALASKRLVFHNASYDIHALERGGLVQDYSDTWRRTLDTFVMAAIDAPLERHGLKPTATRLLGIDGSEADDALGDRFKALGLGKRSAAGWASIAIDDPVYVHYAASDAVATARIFKLLRERLDTETGSKLLAFEMEAARLVAEVERRGIKFDTCYARSAIEALHEAAEEGATEAAKWGISNVNSTAQVAAALEDAGVPLPEKTRTGKPKVDKAVLETCSHPLAKAVLKAKHSGKLAKAYLEAPLDSLGTDGRSHCSIKSMGARTGRMSISNPPLQQLPSGDSLIRKAFIADEGHTIAAADFSQVELRVLAALADETTMKKAIADGVDLHDTTARLLFGDSFTSAQRKLAKATNFLTVYGGGARALARNAGVSPEVAKKALADFKRAYPAIQRYARALTDAAEYGKRSTRLPSGRELPLDRDRLYAAVNYTTQGSAAEVMKEAMRAVDSAGLGGYVLLPIHDELLIQAPEDTVAETVAAVAEAMTMDFLGVRLDAGGEVFGRSWGDGYE